ncbi:MAG: hypothetical protein AAFV29_10775, partial [Myxococcota bacterium]
MIDHSGLHFEIIDAFLFIGLEIDFLWHLGVDRRPPFAPYNRGVLHFLIESIETLLRFLFIRRDFFGVGFQLGLESVSCRPTVLAFIEMKRFRLPERLFVESRHRRRMLLTSGSDQ